MSDKVQRFTQYYDDVVLDDNGELVSFGDYELLRAEVKDLRSMDSHADLTIDRLQAALAAKDKRIEELEKESEWKAMKQLLCADYHIITTEQTDAAWGIVDSFLDEGRGAAEALAIFGIVACEECGGSGVVREHERGYEDGVEDTCPSCNGHGWEIK